MEKIKSVVKDKRVFFLVLMVVFAIITAFYYQKIAKASQNDKEKIISDMWNNSILENINNNEVLTQYFSITQDFDGIQLKLRASSEEMAGKLHVELMCENDQRVIGSWVENANYFIKNKFYDFELQQKEKVTEQTEYLIKIWTEEVQEGENIYLSRTSGDVYAEGNFYIGHLKQEQDIEFNVYKVQEGKYSFLKPMFIIIASVYMFVCILTFYLAFVKQVGIEKVFLLVVGVTGLFYMIIMPPFSSPDEPIHFGTAYKISNEILGTQVVGESGYVVMRTDDANVQYGTIPTVDTYQYTIQNFNKSVKNTDMIDWPHINLNSKNKITHLPGAVGITLGRLLHLGSIPLIYLGRITNLLFYLVLVYFAIKIAPIGKMMYVAISMTPMMLELISSYSYDAVVNGLAFLSIAYICSCIYEKAKIKIVDIIILACLAGFLAPCKIVYSFIFALCVFIPKEKFDKKGYYYLLIGLIVFMIILSNVYVNLGAVTSMSGTETSSSDVVEEQYSLVWCLKNPKVACHIYLYTTYAYGKYYFTTLFGGLLGWLEIKIPDILIYLIAVVTMVSLFCNDNKKLQIKKSHRIISIVIMGSVYVLVLASMLFGITPFGCSLILGVQGRYFLTILPLFVILFANKKLVIARNNEKYLYLCLIVLNMVTLCQVFSTICSR